MELTLTSVKYLRPIIHDLLDFYGAQVGLSPWPEQKFSHENAGKKNRAQINVWIHKKGSDVRRRKCCLLWVTIHTNSNFLSVPHLGNNCHSISLSHHIKRVESRLAERVKPEVDIFQFSLCTRASTLTIPSPVTNFFHCSSIDKDLQFILTLFYPEKGNIYFNIFSALQYWFRSRTSDIMFLYGGTCLNVVINQPWDYNIFWAQLCRCYV